MEAVDDKSILQNFFTSSLKARKNKLECLLYFRASLIFASKARRSFMGGGKPTLLTSVNIRISVVPRGTGCVVYGYRR